QYGLLHQHFVDGRCLQSTVKGLIQVILIVYKTSTGSTQGKRGAYYKGETNFLRKFLSFEEGVGCFSRCYFYAQLNHPLAKLFAVLSLVDGFDVHTNQPHIIFFPNSQVLRLLGEVERGL